MNGLIRSNSITSTILVTFTKVYWSKEQIFIARHMSLFLCFFFNWTPVAEHRYVNITMSSAERNLPLWARIDGVVHKTYFTKWRYGIWTRSGAYYIWTTSWFSECRTLRWFICNMHQFWFICHSFTLWSMFYEPHHRCVLGEADLARHSTLQNWHSGVMQHQYVPSMLKKT